MNVSKKFIAVVMAMLMALSCLVVSVSANDGTDNTTPSTGESSTVSDGGEGEGTGEDTTFAEGPVLKVDLSEELDELELELDKEGKTITTNFEKGTTVEYEGVEYALEVSIAPSKDVFKSYTEDDFCVFSQLVPGTEYTVTVSVVDETEDNKDVTGSTSAKVKLLLAQAKPSAPVPVEITSKSIKISAAVGLLYTITDINGESVGYDWVSVTKAGAIEFEVDGEGEKYIVYAKKAATDTHYESEEASITVTTKKPAPTGDFKLELEDKTNTSITVVAYENVEYSIDGKTYSKTNKFTGLKADTQYTIYARLIANADQDPSDAIKTLVVKTNAKANFEANVKNIKIEAADGQYANSEIKFTVTGHAPANMNEAIYGDTRIVPVAYSVTFGDTPLKEATTWDTVKLTQNGSFTAPGYEEKVVTVRVKFAIEEYKGSEWKEASTFVETKDVKIGRTGDTGTKILEFFEGIFNFLFNTVPAFFAEALKSDVWGRLFEVIGNIGKVLG
ncbi:MAG: hypothetical protein E7516_07055 [Ruminococcaceae bacterium]|nr:hypothetical protein [Oscillospiraceae bacterium]